MKKQRKTNLVDRSAQLGIALKTGSYWCWAMVFIIMTLAIGKSVSPDNQAPLVANVFLVCKAHWPVFIALFAILPVVVIDSIRTSNRFIGPMHRLQEELRRYHQGEKIKPIHFRKGDCYDEIPESINALISKVDDLQELVGAELTAEV